MPLLSSVRTGGVAVFGMEFPGKVRDFLCRLHCGGVWSWRVKVQKTGGAESPRRMLFEGSSKLDAGRSSHNETGDEKHEKYNEEYFRNSCRRTCNAAETEDRCD
jgi:hypothetical protein